MLGQTEVDTGLCQLRACACAGEQRIACFVDPSLDFIGERLGNLDPALGQLKSQRGGLSLDIERLDLAREIQAPDQGLGFCHFDIAHGHADTSSALAATLNALVIGPVDLPLREAGRPDVFDCPVNGGSWPSIGSCPGGIQNIEARGNRFALG